MIIEESGLKFEFNEEAAVVKYDDSSFYRNYMNQLSESKGVDFISFYGERLVFTEVKNFKGHEAESRWRIYPNNKKIKSMQISAEPAGKDSLDIEISKKVAMTIDGLIGAYTKASGCEAAETLIKHSRALISPVVRAGTTQLLIVLVLEGDFGCETRRKTTIMRDLEMSIKKKLAWLNCLVSVVDSDTYKKQIFQIM